MSYNWIVIRMFVSLWSTLTQLHFSKVRCLVYVHHQGTSGIRRIDWAPAFGRLVVQNRTGVPWSGAQNLRRGEGSMMVQNLGRNGYSRIGMSPANMMILILIVLMSWCWINFRMADIPVWCFEHPSKTPIIEYGQIIQIAKIETVWNPSNSRGRHFQKPSWILGHQNAVWETCICPQVFLIPSVVGCCRRCCSILRIPCVCCFQWCRSTIPSVWMICHILSQHLRMWLEPSYLGDKNGNPRLQDRRIWPKPIQIPSAAQVP